MASSLLKAIFFIPLMILILERLLGTANYQRDLFGTIVATELATIEAPSIEQQQQPIKIRGASLEPPTNQTAIIVGEKDNTKSGGGDEEVVARPSNNKKRAAATRIPLNVLVGSDDDVKVGCSDGLMRAPQRHLPYEELFSGGRRIPRIVHQTSKSQCLTKKFFHTVKQWLLLGDDWAYYLHTDEAIDTLFAQDWPEFPHLGLVLQCLEGKGTLKADLWRYLALYQYGGIYVDVDTKPAKFNASTITAQDDGFFTVEQYHLLSQYFMATSPRHPIMFHTIHAVLHKVLDEMDTGSIQAPQVTGPHALNRGFQFFMMDKGVKVKPPGAGKKPAKAGLWVGTDNRSITVAGVGENENEYVIRESIRRPDKIREYKAMGMSHFMHDGAVKSDKSCVRTLWDAYYSKEQ